MSLQESEKVELLARWLYARDAQWLIREDWDCESDEFKERYRAEVREALDG